MAVVWVAVIVAVLVLGYLVWTYNRLVGLSRRADGAWSDIDVQLKRRWDLVPALVATVQGYTQHESEALRGAVAARARAAEAESIARRGESERSLSASVRDVFALVEAYPDLKASQNFLDLQKSLVDIENNVQQARRYYNAVVRDLNTLVATFPALLVARAAGFGERDYFQLDDAQERAAPRVRLGIVVLLAGLFLSVQAAHARANSSWRITQFNVSLVIRPDSRLEVDESIAAQFDEGKHGIFREIPIRYAVGLHQYTLRFRLLGVDDGAGHPRTARVSYDENKVVIKIGDADQLLTGPQTYRIRYLVERAILWEGEHAVLRWNATGTEWLVPIDKATVTIELPRPLDDRQVHVEAWTGAYGARNQDYQSGRTNDRMIAITTAGLRPAEGITVAVTLPADAVQRPGLARRLGWWLGDNFVYAVFPATIAACLSFWFTRGRDLPGRGSIVVQYEPPDGLRPAEVGTLIDEKVDLRDISASIIDFAVRGDLQIAEVKQGRWLWASTDYQFVKTNDPTDLKPFEAKLFIRLFEDGNRVLLSDLKTAFYPVIDDVKSLLYRMNAALPAQPRSSGSSGGGGWSSGGFSGGGSFGGGGGAW